MLIIGIVCLVLGFVFGIQLLWIIGLVLAIAGLVLLLMSLGDHSVGGRRYWY